MCLCNHLKEYKIIQNLKIKLHRHIFCQNTTMSSIPIELLRDIFINSTRNEVEKCQIVCRRWNRTVRAYINYMPLRLLKEVKIYVPKYRGPYPYVEADGELIYRTEESEKIIARRQYVKFCVIGALRLECNYHLENLTFRVSFWFFQVSEVFQILVHLKRTSFTNRQNKVACY